MRERNRIHSQRGRYGFWTHSARSSTQETPVVARERNPSAPAPFRDSKCASWLVLAVITLLYVGTCFAPVIFDDNEGLYAGAVREMHERGDWLVPTSNGFPRVQKPPLVYWTMLVSTSIFGDNEFALRLPNALATAGWIMATYLIMRRLGGERFGIASALVLASMLGVWVFNHLVQPEPFLACFISLAMWCLVEARLFAKPQPRTVSHGGLVAFPRRALVSSFLDFSRLGLDEQGTSRRALAARHGRFDGHFCSRLASLATAGPELARHAGFFCCCSRLGTPTWPRSFPDFSPPISLTNNSAPVSIRVIPPMRASFPSGNFTRSIFYSGCRGPCCFRRRFMLAVKAARMTGSQPDVFSPATLDIIKLLTCWCRSHSRFGRLFHAAGLLQHELLGRGGRLPGFAVDEREIPRDSAAPALPAGAMLAHYAWRLAGVGLCRLDHSAARRTGRNHRGAHSRARYLHGRHCRHFARVVGQIHHAAGGFRRGDVDCRGGRDCARLASAGFFRAAGFIGGHGRSDLPGHCWVRDDEPLLLPGRGRPCRSIGKSPRNRMHWSLAKRCRIPPQASIIISTRVFIGSTRRSIRIMPSVSSAWAAIIIGMTPICKERGGRLNRFI